MIDWNAIESSHGPSVWRAVYRILAHHDDAWDCYQEVFLEAFRSSPTSTVRDWNAYLGTLASRRAIDRLRQRIRSRDQVLSINQVPSPESTDPSPQDRFAADELMGRVRQVLADLPGRQAEVFWLSCIEGLRHEQVAAQLDTTTGAVRMLLNRARSTIAESLKGAFFRRGADDERIESVG